MDFFKEVGGNIYFLDEYDAAKTPILFIHGAAGSPQDWKYFVEHLDGRRYQPWIFYYPSGASLDSMSYLLYWKLGNLQRRYHFNRLYQAAHSMGGLVARSFLANYVSSADNPAGSFREGRRDIEIESIVLTDGADRREIRPADDTRDRTLEAYLAGRDYAFGSFFSFVGLKEGRYELTIKVSGYQPHRQTYSVVPGKYGYLTPIDLEPLR